MFRRKLACSFCRRSGDRVSKLVAGPRVYICDRCAAEVIRIMNDSELRSSPASQRASSIAVLGMVQSWWRRWFTGSSERRTVAHPMTEA
jgi:ATP-dependent protease Clp ATPase subunit